MRTTTPSPHIPTPAHPLSTPRLPRISVQEFAHPPIGSATLCDVCGEELSDDEFPTCEECYVPERDGADYTFVSGWGWF